MDLPELDGQWRSEHENVDLKNENVESSIAERPRACASERARARLRERACECVRACMLACVRAFLRAGVCEACDLVREQQGQRTARRGMRCC